MLIKAVAGGGGKGMRKVERARDFAEALAAAKREAKAAFGEDRVLLEKFVGRPRHIEVQVFADAHGEVVHLFERDCSIQRRHQKVIEEAPAPGMDGATREVLCAAAVRAARAVNYRGAGTVEFIADASDGLTADRIWFMEMNTRLQVEHPVTEAITGLDLVEWQLRIASGEPLPLTQDEISFSGWAMEARLYAEDPASGFLPSVGPLVEYNLPAGVRSDSAVEQGDAVTPFYDPMLAKLVSFGATREAAAAELAAACSKVRAWPVKTNAWFLTRCLSDTDFLAGEADTGFVDRKLDDLARSPFPGLEAQASAAVALAAAASRSDAAKQTAGLFAFRMNARAAASVTLNFAETSIAAKVASDRGTFWVDIGDHRLEATAVGEGLIEVGGNEISTTNIGDDRVVVFEGGAGFECGLLKWGGGTEGEAGDGSVRAPMPGRIVLVAKRAGDHIAAGDTLLILEAMKMEHALKAPVSGVISELHAGEGQQVSEGVVLARIEG